MISPQKAYDILLKNGNTGQLKSAKDIGNVYIFVFNSIIEKKDSIPTTGPFRLSVDKKTGSISMYNMLDNKIEMSKDVTNDIVTFYDKKVVI